MLRGINPFNLFIISSLATVFSKFPALRLLNKCNILGKFIPAFRRIVAQMQHDLFHIYTVDEHTLNVIENIRRFTLQKWKHEFPECNEIFKSFKNPYLLYLSAMFHDIAKGRGGDHSKLGGIVSLRFTKLMNLNVEDRELIAWLVKSHLKSLILIFFLSTKSSMSVDELYIP